LIVLIVNRWQLPLARPPLLRNHEHAGRDRNAGRRRPW
jgi:hypothetical protein